MALIGPGLAIVSVGMSCQVAHQLRVHADAIRMHNPGLQVHATPFDWIICPPAGVAAMLRDGITLPRDPAELEARHKPYWPARGCYYWHVKGAITHHPAALERARQCEARLDDVAKAERRVFIVANTQNNLERQRRAVGGFTVPFDQKGLAALQGALRSRFGACELHVVSHRGKHAGWPRVRELKPDRSSWMGDDAQWGRLLAKILRA